ncbi:MAG TPA: hypothetical protein VJ866_20080 [Pyrinomonadaceae bacterium]|nr:hypothetical protein [Pyrinomonadaceae bacterium]
MRKTLFLALALAAFTLLTVPPAGAQDGTKPKTDAPKTSPAKVDEKAEAVVKRGVEVLGGAAYMDVRTAVSQGYFTQFREGQQGLPVSFRDYVVYPDRERTEFKGAGVRTVQVNTGQSGWLFEAKAKKLTDVTPEQAEDFRTTMRTSVDNLLRGWWRSEGASLIYVGRREAGLARRNEVVRLSYPDGFEAEFEFDAREGLPAKVLYKRPNAEGETVEEEDRYAQFQQLGGVRAPFIIDHYRAGVQSSRVNYESVEFNKPVPESLFAKPTDVKAIKF